MSDRRPSGRIAALARRLRRLALDARGRVRRSGPFALRPLERLRASRLAVRLRSLRARIIIAVGVLLAVGLVNVLVFQYGAARRAALFDELQNAIDRQSLVLDARNLLEKQHRQARLRVELIGVDREPPSDSVRAAVLSRADSIRLQLVRLDSLTGGDTLPLRPLQRKTDSLAASWRRFYEHIGVEPVPAMTEWVGTAEPLGLELLTEDFPAAIRRERRRVQEAREAFSLADRETSRMTFAIFLLSVAIGGLLAVAASRDLLHGINALRLGAERVGQGDLGHRIELRRQDELGDVGESFNRMADRLLQRTEEAEEQERIAESLLRNILPAEIADELRADGRVEPKYLPDTTIMFADLVGFTRLAETLSTERMVRLLDRLFTEFDRVVRAYRLEKLKTIGDAYMCAGGLLREGSSHPIDAVLAGFDFIDAVSREAEREELPLAVRAGIHTGPLAAGVVGIDKFAFDVWGETVNLAARLQTASAENRITVSNATYRRIKDFFTCEFMGPVQRKGERPFERYVVTGVHPEIRGEGEPPAAFVERYRRRFREPPAAYPRCLAEA